VLRSAAGPGSSPSAYSRSQRNECYSPLSRFCSPHQAARSIVPSDARASALLSAVDAYDLSVLKTLLAHIGWFEIPVHGDQADNDGWLLVQRQRQRRICPATASYINVTNRDKRSAVTNSA
jgi:hypothetical protein